MKYIKTFENYKKNKPINEELLGGLINMFKNMWNKATAELRKLGEKPTMAQLDDWIEKNTFNPGSPNYLFKNVIDTFKKKADTETNGEACIKFIGDIIDPETGALGKQGTQPLYDTLLKSFGKNLAPTTTIQYYFDTARNRAIKDYKYAGGPDGGKVDQKKIIADLKDITHLPDLKKILLPNNGNNKKMKESTINWVEKTLLPRLLKYIQEIKPEDVKKYLETKGIKEGGGDAMDYKTLNDFYTKKTPVIYLLKDKKKEDWDKLTDDEKKKPTEGKAAELVGVKEINAINDQDADDSMTFLDKDGNPTIKKGYKDIIGPGEAAEKVEGQDDLVNQLKDIKTKNPEGIREIGDIAKLYTDPVANKDKIDQIKKLLAGEKA